METLKILMSTLNIGFSASVLALHGFYLYFVNIMLINQLDTGDEKGVLGGVEGSCILLPKLTSAKYISVKNCTVDV